MVGASGTTRISPWTSATINQSAGGFGGVEERLGLPDILNVVDSQSGVFEQVGCLPVDLERVVVVELIEIEQLSHQHDCNTNEYRMTDTPPPLFIRAVDVVARKSDRLRGAISGS